MLPVFVVIGLVVNRHNIPGQRQITIGTIGNVESIKECHAAHVGALVATLAKEGIVRNVAARQSGPRCAAA